MLTVLTVVAALGSGVVGGVFFAFSTFVMPALARLPPAEGAAAMQSINVKAINPAFMPALFGTGVVCAALAVACFVHWPARGGALIASGAVLYFLGNPVVTMLFNVPRNNALAAVNARSPDTATLWQRYLVEWGFWNNVRTLTGLAAATLLTLGLISLASAR